MPECHQLHPLKKLEIADPIPVAVAVAAPVEAPEAEEAEEFEGVDAEG